MPQNRSFDIDSKSDFDYVNFFNEQKNIINMKNILIFGGSGKIGFEIAKYLYESEIML